MGSPSTKTYVRYVENPLASESKGVVIELVIIGDPRQEGRDRVKECGVDTKDSCGGFIFHPSGKRGC